MLHPEIGTDQPLAFCQVGIAIVLPAKEFGLVISSAGSFLDCELPNCVQGRCQHGRLSLNL